MTTTVDEQSTARATLTLAFSADMPPAMVEVIAPDMRTLASVLMRAGQRRDIITREPAHSICVHMPGNRSIFLSGDDIREPIERRKLEPPSRRSEGFRPRSTAATYRPRVPGTLSEFSAAMVEESRLTETISPQWEWALNGAKRIPGSLAWVASGESPVAMDLRGTFGKNSIRVRVPGNARRVAVTHAESSPVAPITIEITSRSAIGDMFLEYLSNSLGPAAVHDLLKDGAPKIGDPFAACVLAYMLLRVRRFDAPALGVFAAAQKCVESDAAVIAAWCLLAHEPERIDEIDRHLDAALEQGMPVYSEGLRLLVDALLLRGQSGRSRLAEWRERYEHVFWSSPLTTLMERSDSRALPARVSVSIKRDPA
jgi:hypothetical protein